MSVACEYSVIKPGGTAIVVTFIEVLLTKKRLVKALF